MKRILFIALTLLAALGPPSAPAAAPVPPRGQAQPPALAWNLLWAGSWEEGGNLDNRGDLRLGLPRLGLSARAQVLDRRRPDFESGLPWAGFRERTAGGAALGLYHGATGSRLLYGAIQESGLPARVRGPWSRAAPFAENRRPASADLRTASSRAMATEAYLYLSSPRLSLFEAGALSGMSLRGFASAQAEPGRIDRRAFSGGMEASLGAASALLEGFFAADLLPARGGSAWFGGSPALPEREHRLAAASLSIGSPYILFASDLAASRTFAYGGGLYGSAAIRVSPPLPGQRRAGPWSLSLSAEGMGERFADRAGAPGGGGLRAACRVERRGPRGSLFRADAGLRAPAPGEAPDRSSMGVSYRFPAPSARALAEGGFPLRASRASLGVGRNASGGDRAHDSLDAALGLSIALPPMVLPPALLPASATRTAASARRPRIYPVGVGLSAALRSRDHAEGGAPSPIPFSREGERRIESLRAGCELSWSPGIFQLRTRWAYAARPGGDGRLEGSASLAARLGRGRLSAGVSWGDFPARRSYSVSWRAEAGGSR